MSGSTVISPNFVLSSTAPPENLGLGTGWVSRRYRERTQGPVVTCSWNAVDESVVSTLLYPFSGEPPHIGLTDVTPSDGRGRSTALRIDNGRFQDMVYVCGDSTRGVGNDVMTDADILFLRKERGGVRCFTAVQCSYLIVGGKSYHLTPGVKTDVSFDGELLEINGVNVRRCESRVPAKSTVLMNGRPVSVSEQGEMLICE